MKIIVIQSGAAHEVLLITSLLIGLRKRYQDAQIIWVGEPKYFDLVKYNNRIDKIVDISDKIDLSNLRTFYDVDLCVNPSMDQKACQFVSAINASKYYGFTKNGASDGSADFMYKILTGDLSTNKTILDLYYGLADLKWKGEGYGLSYYPRTKQIKSCGATTHFSEDECEPIKLPKNLLSRFDVLNEYEKVLTDDLFTLHAAISLRKHSVFYTAKPLPYRIEYFKKGKTIVLQ